MYLFTGLLKDLKMVTKSDKSMVIDPNKIRRWKKKVMNLLCVRRKREVGRTLTAVYFDSKQCKLLVKKLINGKEHTVTGKEDLYVLIEVFFYVKLNIFTSGHLEYEYSIFGSVKEPKESLCLSVRSAQSALKHLIFIFLS